MKIKIDPLEFKLKYHDFQGDTSTKKERTVKKKGKKTTNFH